MTWGLRRQIFYVAVLIVFFGVLAFLIILPNLNKAPTCADGQQNSDEGGVDCGGSCLRACIAKVDEITVLWARAFRVVPGRYNAVAYLENHNQNVAINKISYRFRFADANNIYIGKREGTTFVPSAGKFAVFEPALDLGSSIPVYVSFEFTSLPDWIQVSKEKLDQLKILVSGITLEDEETAPRLFATLKNRSFFMIPEVDVIAILYDASHNAISASRTYLDLLSPLETREVAFTWSEPFAKKVVTQEIIPLYNIFLAKLK